MRPGAYSIPLIAVIECVCVSVCICVCDFGDGRTLGGHTIIIVKLSYRAHR